jgi:hypothetical protein
MPDPVVIVTAIFVALAVAGLVLGILCWPNRPNRAALFDMGWVVSIGAGFFFGCLILGIRPHWPPREDLDRLLVVVLPAVVVVELLAARPQIPRWLVWPSRFLLVAGGARVLLHGTSYITDITGPGTSEWSPGLAWLIFGTMAAIEATVWSLVSLLARRTAGLSVAVCLAVTSAGAGVTVMLSGYNTGGQVGLPLAAALIGATATAFFLPRTSRAPGPLGLPVVGLFSLLVIGRFYGELTSPHAVALFCAPVLGWLTELPYVRRLPAWGRSLARVAIVGALVFAIVVTAQAKFFKDFQSPSGRAPDQPSVHDYLNFGR